MRQIFVIGIGTGNPDHVTIQAINAMKGADRVFIPTKGTKKEELASVRREICDRYLDAGKTKTIEFAVPQRQTEGKTYVESVDEWHAAIAANYASMIGDLGENEAAAFLVWGDPSLYDSTLRILERIRGSIAFEVTVIPGITSIQALAASHKIPVNLVGKPVEITTGRRLADEGLIADSTVVMLDGIQAFSQIDDPDAEIFWGAYLGTADEIIHSGRLGDVSDEIVKMRAAARERHGWIMDIYLLRKGRDFEA
jgi:precorrin-6A synthase